MSQPKPDPATVARIVTVGAWITILAGGTLVAAALVLLVLLFVVEPNLTASKTQPLALLGGMGVFGTIALMKGLGRLRRLRQGLPIT